MEKENMTTPREAAQGADARTESGAAAPTADLGKFKSVDALLNAYNSLEAEFTRRSQRLRELEGRMQGENKVPSAPEGEVRQQPHIDEQAIEAAVEKYLASRAAPVIMGDGGSHAPAPAPRVRSLEEAGRLAQELFRKNA